MLSTSMLCARTGIQDEERKTRSDPAAVDDLHVAQTHLSPKLARRFVGGLAPFDRQRKGELHFAVVLGVAVWLDESRPS